MFKQFTKKLLKKIESLVAFFIKIKFFLKKLQEKKDF